MIGGGATSTRIRALLFLVVAVAALSVALLFVRYLLPTDLPSTDRSTNVLRMAAANLAFDNSRVEEVSAAVGRLRADVLIVLEWTGHNLILDGVRGSELRVVLDEPSLGPHGVLVLARRTLPTAAALAPTPVPGPCPMPIATVRVLAGRHWVSVLGVHAPPSIAECEESNLPTLRFLAGLIRDGRLAADLGVGRRGDRVILAGDLNASPSSPGLGWLRDSGLVDSHARDRWLPRGTWASTFGPHLIRLDYVLGAQDVDVLGSWTVDLPGSDHRAVIADLHVPR